MLGRRFVRQILLLNLCRSGSRERRRWGANDIDGKAEGPSEREQTSQSVDEQKDWLNRADTVFLNAFSTPRLRLLAAVRPNLLFHRH
jgi:hypothetical protein